MVMLQPPLYKGLWRVIGLIQKLGLFIEKTIRLYVIKRSIVIDLRHDDDVKMTTNLQRCDFT